MKHFVAVSIAVLFLQFAQAQSLSEKFTGAWLEKQTYASTQQWFFSKNSVSVLLAFGNGTRLGGHVRKGSFVVNEDRKKIIINFSKSQSLTDETVATIAEQEEWDIIQVGPGEIVLARPKLSTEKQTGSVIRVHLRSVFKFNDKGEITGGQF